MRVLIVDDEPLARTRLRELLLQEEGVEVAGECGDVAEARAAIARHDPDAVFLDIEMPGESGLELAREAEAAGRPLIVFVTAHPRYAVDAFEAAPVDYIIKPAEPLRCRRAVRRLERLLALRNPGSAPAERYVDRLFVKNDDRLVCVRIDEIEAIEALGNYVKLRTGNRSYALRCSLAALESRLDPSVFVRTHRSFLVNVARIVELEPVSHGDYTIVLRGGAKLPLSRAYRERLDLLVIGAAAVAL